jgi:hypothetical protein
MKIRYLLSVAVASLMLEVLSLAGSRGSADYTIPADSLDAGGSRNTSAHYTVDATFSSVGGVSTAVAPAQTLKHGYAGQLYDIRSLLISGTPSPVNEGATMQLSAGLACDDDTRVALTPSSVSWSVVGGPASTITAGGLLTAARVYGNEEQLVRSEHLGWVTVFETQVNDLNPDDWGAYAGDGLPDYWQVQNFGPDNPTSAGPTADPDADGQNNLFEHTVGSDPTSASSRFRLTLASAPAPPGGVTLLFSPRLPGRTYTVQYRDRLGAGTFAPLPGASIVDNGQERTVTDLNAPEPARFYRVQISLP